MAEKHKISLRFKRKQKIVDSDQRITNDTLSDFRQGVIERGRKFKYPIQYERHKVVINAMIVALLTLVVLIVLTWWGLYRSNANNLVLFKLTQILPIPVGEIDGEAVNYGNYLAQYRSSLHYYQTKEGLPTDDKSLEELKKQFRSQAFFNAATISLARKIALRDGIVVSNDERNADLNSKLSYGGSRLSKEAYDEIMLENYGLNRTEYERLFVDNPLLVRKVAFAVDEEARLLSEEIAKKIAVDGSNFQALAEEYGDGRTITADSGLVKHTNSDGGRAQVALSLELNHVSGPFKSTDSSGYYFVKLISKDDLTLRYQSILVPLTEFNKLVESARQNNNIKAYANIDINFGS